MERAHHVTRSLLVKPHPSTPPIAPHPEGSGSYDSAYNGRELAHLYLSKQLAMNFIS